MKLNINFLLFVAIGTILFFLQKSDFAYILHEKIWMIFVFFLAIGFLNHQLMKFAFEKNKEKFIVFFMASVVGRLILSLLFLGVFIFLKLENVQLFAVNFFALYLCVLIFEIFENSRNLR